MLRDSFPKVHRWTARRAANVSGAARDDSGTEPSSPVRRARIELLLLSAAAIAAAWGQLRLADHDIVGWGGYLAALGLAMGATRVGAPAPLKFSLPPRDARLRTRWWVVGVAALCSAVAGWHQLQPAPNEPRIVRWWLGSLVLLLASFLVPAIRRSQVAAEADGVGLGLEQPAHITRWLKRVRSHWLEIAAAALLLAAALACRLPYLERFPAAVHNDEASCGLMAQQVLERRAHGDRYWFRFCSDFFDFPALGFFPSAAGQAITGTNLYGHRLANVVLSMASLICLYLLVRSLFGRSAALLCMGLAATAHAALHWSRSGIHSGHATWLTVICLYLAWKAFSSGRLQWFVVLGYATASCLLTYSAAYLIPVFLAVTIATFWVADSGFRRRYSIPIVLCCLSALMFLGPMIAEFQKAPFDILRARSASMVWSDDPGVMAHMRSFSDLQPRREMVTRNLGAAIYLLRDSGDSNTQYGNREIGMVDGFTAVMLVVGLGVLLAHAGRFNHWPLLLLIVLNLLGGAVLAVSGVQYSRIAGLAMMLLIVPAIGLQRFVGSASRAFGTLGAGLAGIAVLAAVIFIGYENLDYYFVRHDRATWRDGGLQGPDARRSELARRIRDLGDRNVTFLCSDLVPNLGHQTFRLICGHRHVVEFQSIDDLHFESVAGFETATFLMPAREVSLRLSRTMRRREAVGSRLAEDLASRLPGGAFLDTSIPFHPERTFYDAYRVPVARLPRAATERPRKAAADPTGDP